MNAKLSVQLNVQPEKALECAYETLLSIRKPEKMWNVDHFNKELLLASVKGKFKPTNYVFLKFICLIKIDKINECSCRLTIIVDGSFMDSSRTVYSYSLISDFFDLFSQNLSQE